MIIGIRKVFTHKAWEAITHNRDHTHVIGKYPSMQTAMKIYMMKAEMVAARNAERSDNGSPARC